VVRLAAGEQVEAAEPRLDQRDQARHAEPRRRERAADAHADGDVVVEHVSREELHRFAQACPVVGEEGVVDQLGDAGRGRDRARIDAGAAEKLVHAGHWRSRSKSAGLFKAGALPGILDASAMSLYPCGVRILVLLLATVGGVGYAPAVPGTLGSLVALPLLPALATLRTRAPLPGRVVVAALLPVAFWAADRADRMFPGHDHGCIVIDEVAGMIVAGLFVPGTWAAATLVFVLFRVLDVLKPWPANVLDRHVRSGFGIVSDDLVAGAYAGIAARVVLAVA